MATVARRERLPTRAKTKSVRKTELERRKLELEINELQLAWWKRPAYLGLSLPVALAVIAFFSALLSGYFDERKAHLESQIEELRAKRDELVISNTAIQDDLRITVASYRRTIAFLVESDLYALRNEYSLPTNLSSEREWCELGGLNRKALDFLGDEVKFGEASRTGRLSGRVVALGQLVHEGAKISQFVGSGNERSRLTSLIAAIVSEANNNAYNTLEARLVDDNGNAARFSKTSLNNRMFLDFDVYFSFCKILLLGDEGKKDEVYEAAKRSALESLAARVAYHDFMVAVSEVLVAEVVDEKGNAARLNHGNVGR